jgi:hypothetical protein
MSRGEVRFSELSRAAKKRKLAVSARARRAQLPMLKLADVVCGIPVADDCQSDSDYTGIVSRLYSDVEELDTQVLLVTKTDCSIPTSAVFPFLARKLLETSLTGLLARFDPLRVLAARKNQRDASYGIGRQNASSIAWSGDIFPKGKAPQGNPWESDNLNKGVERSLLGWHVAEVAITPGLGWLADQDNSKSEWLRELGSQERPIEWIKGRLTQLYSTLSKGVHAEYLLDDRSAFDPASIKQHLGDCYTLISVLAVATHVCPLFYRSLPPQKALQVLHSIENQILEH